MHITEPLSDKKQYNGHLPINDGKDSGLDGIWNLLKGLMRRQMCCFNAGSSPAETATVDGSVSRQMQLQTSHFNWTVPQTTFPLSKSNSSYLFLHAATELTRVGGWSCCLRCKTRSFKLTLLSREAHSPSTITNETIRLEQTQTDMITAGLFTGFFKGYGGGCARKPTLDSQLDPGCSLLKTAWFPVWRPKQPCSADLEEAGPLSQLTKCK